MTLVILTLSTAQKLVISCIHSEYTTTSTPHSYLTNSNQFHFYSTTQLGGKRTITNRRKMHIQSDGFQTIYTDYSQEGIKNTSYDKRPAN